MRAFRKILIIVTSLLLGGYLGTLFAPHDFTGQLESLQGIMTVVTGTLSGLFIGGGLCLLVDD